MARKKKKTVIILHEADIPKVRKIHAPGTKIVKDATKYTRKAKHKARLNDPQTGFVLGFTLFACKSGYQQFSL